MSPAAVSVEPSRKSGRIHARVVEISRDIQGRAGRHTLPDIPSRRG